MPREASLHDLQEFMDDDERQYFDAPERTQEERNELLARLQVEWQRIPDPELDDLKPPYMPSADWAAHESGSKHVIPFHTRRWKKQRRITVSPDVQPPEKDSPVVGDTSQPEPPKRGMEISELEKRCAEQRASEEQPRKHPFISDDTYQDMLMAIGKAASEIDVRPVHEALAESFKKVADSLPPVSERSVEDIIEAGKPKLPDLAERVPEFAIASFQPLQPEPEADQTISVEDNASPDNVAMSDEAIAQQASWPKVIIGVLVAFLVFCFAVASAFQNAGVENVLVAHSMIFAGWLLFMLSIGFADYYLPLAKPIKIKLLTCIGVTSLFFAICADVVMVKLKNQQQTERLQSPQPTPTSSGNVVPSQPQPSVANVEEQVPLDIAPEKLLVFFEKYNEAQVEDLIRPYIGKWVELSGKVTEVRREALVPREGDRALRYGIEVTFSNRRADRSKVVVVHRALFDEQRWMDRAVVLQRNEFIKARGKLKHVFFYGFYLDHCEIIE